MSQPSANGPAKSKLLALIGGSLALGVALTFGFHAFGPSLGIHDWKGALAAGWHLPNFIILCALLWYYGRGPVKELLVQRRADLAATIADAERQKLAAEDRHHEYQEKLQRIEQELGALKQSLRQESEREKERILAQAREEAQRVKNEAEFTAKQELRKAQAALREEAAALTVELAEKLIRETITDQDREKILRDYLHRVEAKP